MARYLVTGGAGFIASHITEALLKQGHQVKVIDDLSSGRLENLAAVKSKVEFHQGDIRDRALVAKAMKGVEFVIHAAAWRSVPKSMADPYGYCEVNDLGTVNLLEAAAKEKAKRFVAVSSSSVYGDTDKMPLKEDMPCAPISPYAVSKLADEIWCGMFSRSFNIETACVRYFNVFGGRQSLENEYAVVVPKFIMCCLKGEQPPVYGDGKQSRDFTYIDNVAEATILASTAPGIKHEVFNIALGEEHTVIDLLDTINKILGTSIKPKFVPPRPGDVRRTLADPSKAMKMLKWKGSVNFAEGIKRTVEWFKANPVK